MLTGKQRSFLRGIANGTPTILLVGKEGVTPLLVESVNEALAARELVKIGVNNNCETEAAEVAEMVSSRTRSEVVQLIGKKIVLFKRSDKNIIELPKK